MIVPEPEILTLEPLSGIINAWPSDKNYGFIEYAKGSMFVHADECPDEKRLPIGTKVRFQIELNHVLKKKRAVNVSTTNSSRDSKQDDEVFRDDKFAREYAEKSQKFSVGPTGPHLAHGQQFSPY